MKYLIVITDGAGDYAIESLGGKTPLETAEMPCIDSLAARGTVGTCRTVPEGILPGSDSANLSVMGYDPRIYLTGRSPLETASIGVDMKEDDISFRVNFVTLEPADSGRYEDFVIKDHAAGDITTEEGAELLKVVEEAFGSSQIRFYAGTQYRHCMIWSGQNIKEPEWAFVPPHDVLGQRIGDYMPKGKDGEMIAAMYRKSYDLLKNHPVNKRREALDLNPANSVWIWGEGTRPSLPDFNKKYGVKGCVISAIDLIKGIGIFAGLKILKVEGITGNIHTNFEGKAKAAIEAYKSGSDFVYLHLEGPDECSHQGNLTDKVKCLEYIDRRTVKPVVEFLKNEGEEFRVLVLPDHRTPLALRTHTSEPVPFVMYDSNDEKPEDSSRRFSERSAAASGIHFEEGYMMTDWFFGR